MGAPKYKNKYPLETQSLEGMTEDQKMHVEVKYLIKVINKKMENEEEQKKAAHILHLLINKKL